MAYRYWCARKGCGERAEGLADHSDTLPEGWLRIEFHYGDPSYSVVVCQKDAESILNDEFFLMRRQ